MSGRIRTDSARGRDRRRRVRQPHRPPPRPSRAPARVRARRRPGRPGPAPRPRHGVRHLRPAAPPQRRRRRHERAARGPRALRGLARPPAPRADDRAGRLRPARRLGPLPRRDPDPRVRPRRAGLACATCGPARPASGATTPAWSSPSTTARSWPATRVVLATGERPPGTAWAPDALQRSAFFVPDPWAPGAVDVVRRDAAGPADVLLVGTGLTMVDVVLSLTGPSQRPDRRLHAVSRHGELPERHADELQLAAIPEIDDWGDTLEGYRVRATEHIAARPAVHRRLAPGRRRPAHRRPGPVAAARRGRPHRVPPRGRQRLGPGAPPHASLLGRRDRRAGDRRHADPLGR